MSSDVDEEVYEGEGDKTSVAKEAQLDLVKGW